MLAPIPFPMMSRPWPVPCYGIGSFRRSTATGSRASIHSCPCLPAAFPYRATADKMAIWVVLLALISYAGGLVTGWVLLQHLGYALGLVVAFSFLFAFVS